MSVESSTVAPARVIVFGYDDAAIVAVETIAAAGGGIAGIVLPSNRSGPKLEALRTFARERDLTTFVQPPRARVAELVDHLRRVAADLFVVWSYPMILPAAVFELPRLGTVNLHGGLLPEYRGGHVLQWAIINGENETGVTLHHVQAEVDRGPVIGCERVPIDPDDDAASVRERLLGAGKCLLVRFWPQLAAGTAPRIVQDESRARYYPLRTPDDGLIDWSWPAIRLRNLVRALVPPWPGAFTFLRGEKVVVGRASVVKSVSRTAEPGVVLDVTTDGITVATGDGALCLHQASRECGRSFPVTAGDRFGAR